MENHSLQPWAPPGAWMCNLDGSGPPPVRDHHGPFGLILEQPQHGGKRGRWLQSPCQRPSCSRYQGGSNRMGAVALGYVDIPASLGEGQPNPWKRFQGELPQRQAGLPIGEQQQTDSPDSPPIHSKHPVHRQVLLPKHAFSGRANRQMRAGRCGPPATCQASGRCVKSTLCIYPTLTRLWHAPGMTEASLSTGIPTGTVEQTRSGGCHATHHTPHPRSKTSRTLGRGELLCL